MGYTKATDVLPQKLVEHIQSYVDGKLLYIPRKPSAKREWGDNTDTKKSSQHEISTYIWITKAV